MNVNTTALALNDDQTEFNEAQIAVLRSLGVEKANRADLAVFFHVSKRTGLDPFARQIFMIERWTKDGPKQTIQTGIDGFRLVAQRTCERRGERLSYEDTQWCGKDGQWVDAWLSDEPPAAARVVVLRDGSRFPAVALMKEYAQTTKQGGLTKMWAEKGALMLAKCAEAQALRKAFPLDLSGVYASDELANAPTGPQRQQVTPAPVSAAAFVQQPAADPATGEVIEGEVEDVDPFEAGDQA